MTMTTDSQLTFEQVKDLSELASRSFKVSNRAWLALMAVAVVVLIPRPEGTAISLPFGFGEVDPAAFYFVTLIILVAVTIAFAATHAQAFRAHRITMAALGTLAADAVATPLRVHPRDAFDLLVEPTINRVGPLAILVRGRHLMLPVAASAPLWRQRLVLAYYLLLKSVAFVFYFVVPSYALLRAFEAALVVGIFRWVVLAGVAVASLTLLHVMAWEFVHIWRTVRVGLGARSALE